MTTDERSRTAERSEDMGFGVYCANDPHARGVS